MVRDTTIWSLAVLILFIAVVLPGLNVAGNDNTALQSVENESIVVDYDNASAVDPDLEPLSFEPNATVTKAGGTELVNGTDYEWRPVNGTVAWFNTTSTSDGETVEISYEYHSRSRMTRDINGVMAIIAQVWPFLILFAGVGAALKYGSPW